MKRRVIFLGILLLSITSLFSQNREQLLDLGRRSFQDQLYSQAIGHLRDFMDYYPTDPRGDMALYMTAVSWYYLRNYPSVLLALDYLERDYPLSSYLQLASYWRGQSYYSQGEYSAAAEKFQEQLDQPIEDYYYPRSLLYLGLTHEKMNQWDQAKQWYERMLEELDNQTLLVQAHFRLGLVAMQLGNFSLALNQFQILSLNYTNSPFARDLPYFTAICYSRMGDLSEANRRFRSYLQLNPQGALRQESLQNLAENLRASGELDQALSVLQQLSEEVQSPQVKLRAMKLMASLHMDLEQWDSALELMEQIYQRSTGVDRLQAAFSLAELNLMRGDSQGAGIYLEEVVSQGEGDILRKSLYLLAQQRREAGMVEEAMALYTQYWRDYPSTENHMDAGRWLISLYQQEDRMDQAFQFIEDMLLQYPSDRDRPAYLFMKGDYLMTLGEVSQALEIFFKLSQDFPEDEYGMHGLYRVGYIYAEREEHIRASQYFRELLDRNPPTDLARDGLFSLALSQYLGGQSRAALDLLDRYLETYPQDERQGDVAYYLGDIHYQDKSYTQAFDYFDLAAQVPGPRQIKSLYMQGLCRYEEERWLEGREILLSLHESYPDDKWGREALYMMGVGARNAGEFEIAQQDLESASQLYQDDLGERSLFMLVQVFLDQQMDDQAMLTLNSIKARYPQGNLAPNLIYRQGDLAFAQEEYREALQWYELCIRQYEDHNLSSQSLLRGAQSRMELLDYEKAGEDLLTYIEKYPQGAFQSQAARSLSELIRRLNDPWASEELYQRVLSLEPSMELKALCYLAVKRNGGYPDDGTQWLEQIFREEELTPLIRNEALLLLALDHERNGRLEEAEDLYEVLISTDSGSLGAEAQFSLARVVSLEDPISGAEHYMNLYYLYPQEARWASEALFRAWEIYITLEDQQRKADIVEEKLREEYPFSEWIEELP